MRRSAAILVAVASVLVGAATPATAEFRLERRLPLDANGTFTLDSDSGSVTLTGDSNSGVVVTVTSPSDEVPGWLDLQFSDARGGATVTARRRDSVRSFLGGWSRGIVHFDVHVPRSAAIDLRTAGGSIRANGVAGPASLHTSGGSINVMDVRGDVRASTSGGSVEVREAGGRVDAHTSGGHVAVSFARGNNRGGDLSTSGGGVRADIDPKVALSIEAATSGGNVQSDVPVTVRGSVSRQSLRGDLNGGGPPLRMHSSGGGIRIYATP